MALLHDKRLVVPFLNDLDFSTEVIRVCHIHRPRGSKKYQAGFLRHYKNRVRIKQDVSNRAALELQDACHEILTFDLKGFAKVFEGIILPFQFPDSNNSRHFFYRPQDAQQGSDVINPDVKANASSGPGGKRLCPNRNFAVSAEGAVARGDLTDHAAVHSVTGCLDRGTWMTGNIG